MFFTQLLNGILLGSTYALSATGFTLVFGALRLMNLAHGELFMLAPFAALAVAGVPWLPAALAWPLAVLAGAALSAISYLLCFMPAPPRHHFAPVLGSVGLAMVLQTAAKDLWGAEAIRFTLGQGGQSLHVGRLDIPALAFWVLGVAVALALAMHLLLTRSSAGRAMRAVSENPEMAGTLGINVRGVTLFTFAVSGALAATAGLLVASLYGVIHPFTGTGAVLKAIVAIVLGGMGHVWGAICGGLIVGAAEVLTVAYSSSSHRDLVAFGILVLILAVRPQGLFGALARGGDRL